MRKFLHDTRGAYAIEFAIMFPLALLALGAGFGVTTHQTLFSNAQYLAQVGAMASANYCANLNYPNRWQCEPDVRTMLQLNAQLMLDPTTYSTFQMAFTYPNPQTTTLAITISTPNPFPLIGGDVFTSTATASQ
jgi:Flp pilus assembly pilin Flp